MYLFTRRARPSPGDLIGSMAWATKVTERINTVGELDVSLWRTVFSPGVGTLSWSCVVADLAQLEAEEAKLTTDDGYLALAEEGARYASADPVDDSVVRYIHLDRDMAEGKPQLANVTAAVLAPGNAVAGIELGLEIAQRAKAITGRPTSFGSGMTGTYGNVGWIALYDTVDQVQQASEALAADADFAALLDAKAASAYIGGASTQTLLRRVV